MSEFGAPATAPAASTGDPPEGARARHHILLITGMSGAGKTTALKALEDLGFECIDHLPLRLLPRLLPTEHDDSALPAQRLAIGVDVRTRDFAVETCLAIIGRLRLDPAIAVQLIFLYCDEEELRRRYTATRHRHPLSGQMPLIEGIARERQMLSPLRSRADLTIDTSAVNPGHLKRMLQGHLGLTEQTSLLIQVTSFSFRSGLPRDADLVFDVRFLANPYYQAELRGLTGRDGAVQQFIRGDGAYGSFLTRSPAYCSRCCRATSLKGKAPDHRHRLHRRPAPICVRYGRAHIMAEWPGTTCAGAPSGSGAVGGACRPPRSESTVTQ